MGCGLTSCIAKNSESPCGNACQFMPISVTSAPLPGLFAGISAPVAQLDRALDYESRGREFESSRAHHFPSEAYCGCRYYSSTDESDAAD
jgi:hypothetical protein